MGVSAAPFSPTEGTGMAVKAQLFITCLAEQFFPNVLKGMVELLERLGVQVAFPREQTCCGQPFFNSGYRSQARELAIKWLDVFGETDGFIVSPSGSCVDMVRHHFPALFPPESPEHHRAVEVGKRTFEFTQFLVNQLKVTDVGARFPRKVTYHASCHLLRGLGAREEPKALLRSVHGVEMVPLPGEETCCGFGGVFSVIYPEVSKAMMEAKVRAIDSTGADVVVACDAGCIMNIAGGLRKAGSPVRAMHLIEILTAGRGAT
jgi:L-lactate dehydrogenase complex protein LldE